MTIPGSSSTGSKSPEALFGNQTGVPRRFVRSEGCRVWDEEGREYLDLVMSLGAVALGYGHPEVVEAAERAMRDGVAGPLPHVLEHEVAERLAAVLPGVESVRFFKTGAEAVAAAVRVARTYTARENVLTCGYHGWLDWCSEVPGVPRPVQDLRIEIPFNEMDALSRAFEGQSPPAALVLEPVVEEGPRLEWLQLARDLCSASGTVLIFDEIKTALRIAVGGAAERYGIEPDITVVGKALGNGLPIAAIGGRSELMSVVTRTWISSTLATEHVSLAAARAVLDVYQRENVVSVLESRGDTLLESLRSVAASLGSSRATVRGIPQMCYIEFRDENLSTQFSAAAARQGVLFKRNAYDFVSLAHGEEDMRLIHSRLEAATTEVEHQC